MDFKDILRVRRSTRKFLTKPVPRAVVEEVMHEALKAPSAKNTRSTHLLAVDNAALIEQMSLMRDSGSEFMKNAPVAVVVMGDKEATDVWDDNCAIVATYLQLACVDSGLCSCWVHVKGRPRYNDTPDGERADQYLRGLLDLPEKYGIECIIALGYSDFTPAALPVFDADSCIGWYDKK